MIVTAKYRLPAKSKPKNSVFKGTHSSTIPIVEGTKKVMVKRRISETLVSKSNFALIILNKGKEEIVIELIIAKSIGANLFGFVEASV